MILDRAHLYSRRANRWILAALGLLALTGATAGLAVWLAWAGSAWPAIGCGVSTVLIFASIRPAARRGRYWIHREMTELAHLLRERP